MVYTRSKIGSSPKGDPQAHQEENKATSKRGLQADVKDDLVKSAPHASPELLQRAAEAALSADRPAAAATQIKKKVKVAKNRPSIATADLSKLQTKADRIYHELMELFEDPPCPLDHQSSFQLLVSVILSAQVSSTPILQVLHDTFFWRACSGSE